MAIVNVVGSTIAREADHIFYTLAGPEIAVATTKAYSTQLVAGYLLGVQFAHVRGTITEEKYEELLAALQELPDQIAKLLEDDKRTHPVVRSEICQCKRRVLHRPRHRLRISMEAA